MVVHLHPFNSPRPVCGAPIPEDRKAHLTAWRSDITCEACLATLRPVVCPVCGPEQPKPAASPPAVFNDEDFACLY